MEKATLGIGCFWCAEAAFKLLKDEEKVILWKSKISLLDLKKANTIINNNF